MEPSHVTESPAGVSVFQGSQETAVTGVSQDTSWSPTKDVKVSL